MEANDVCSICTREIPTTEKAFVWKSNLVCAKCYTKQSAENTPDDPSVQSRPPQVVITEKE